MLSFCQFNFRTMRICHSKKLARCMVSSRTHALISTLEQDAASAAIFLQGREPILGGECKPPTSRPRFTHPNALPLQGPHHVQLLVNSSRGFGRESSPQPRQTTTSPSSQKHFFFLSKPYMPLHRYSVHTANLFIKKVYTFSLKHQRKKPLNMP